MLFADKKRYIVAGLVSSITLGTGLAATPALASEDYTTLTSDNKAVAEQTFTTDGQTVAAPEGTDEGISTGDLDGAGVEDGSADGASDGLTDGTGDGADAASKETDNTDAATKDENGTISDGSDAVADKPEDANGVVDDTFSVDGDANIATFEENNANKAVDERDVTTDGWKTTSDGKVYLVSNSKVVTNAWVVTSSYKNYGLQRYWFGKDGYLAVSRLIDPTKEDSSWYAYATHYGYVVRGVYTDPTTKNIYLANNDGKLENPGWLVTSSYGQSLQRYYIDATTHSAVVGYSADGWAHYTTNAGYVLRGTLKVDDKIYLADNDGKLARAGSTSNGWVVSSAYGQSLQRYYVYGHNGADGGYTKVGFSSESWNHYTTSAGYVLRSILKDGSNWYSANNDGKLAASSWLVTTGFGQGLQRYWVGSDSKVVFNRYVSSSETKSYATYATDKGYVLRGVLKVGDKVYLADNDGKLARSGSTTDGWVVSSAYGQGLQRYYVYGHNGSDGGYARVGYSDGSWAHYTTNAGYVLRGTLSKTEGGVTKVYLADNDGKLARSGSTSDGWVVSSAYGHGLQRYYVYGHTGTDGGYAKVGRSDEGWDHYTRPEGYVVRGSYTASNGVSVRADNDGLIYTTLVGIDIHPDYQAGIDLSKIDADFVIIKISQGTSMNLASKAKKLADAALAAGKKIGFYHFVDTRKGAIAEADYFSNLVKDYAGRAVFVLDWEDNEAYSAGDPGRYNVNKGPSYAKQWLDRVYQNTGVKSMIYMSRAVTREYNWSSVANSGYKLWVAQYLNKYYDEAVSGHIANPTLVSGSFGAWGSPTIYQYTSRGYLDGWRGELDFNVFYGSANMWDEIARKC